MRLALMEGRHEQAADEGFSILRHKHLPLSFTAEVRGRLADALEGLERIEGAREQRRQGWLDVATGDDSLVIMKIVHIVRPPLDARSAWSRLKTSRRTMTYDVLDSGVVP